LPLLELDALGDGRGVPLPPHGDQPLSGLRVLDLTRVIAGPVCGRTLASYGAEVTYVTARHLPQIPAVVIDTGFGKRAELLDLREDGDRERLRDLVRRADAIIEGYRPGALTNLGFGPHELAALNPSIVAVEISAYGRAGPWAGRRGYDSLVQTASGIAAAEGAAWRAGGPRHLPAQALDHATGYLAALATMAGLERRPRRGGTHVRLSLAQTGTWLQAMGRVDDIDRPDPAFDEVTGLMADMDSDFGALRFVRPAGGLSVTPPAWSAPPPRLT
jgi:crotonobetainyl-CoA:carnitine CoA-transferase CaiB-like acyl-CoA transferase